jgi:hypothetical protein
MELGFSLSRMKARAGRAENARGSVRGSFCDGSIPVCVIVRGGDTVQTLAVDALFHGEIAVEAALIGGKRVTGISSASPTGRKVSSRLLRSRRKSSGLSPSSRTRLLARRPWVRRLRIDVALPAALVGPVDFLAFSRLALMRASVRVRGSSGFFICVIAGALAGSFRLHVTGAGFGRAAGRIAALCGGHRRWNWRLARVQYSGPRRIVGRLRPESALFLSRLLYGSRATR